MSAVSTSTAAGAEGAKGAQGDDEFFDVPLVGTPAPGWSPAEIAAFSAGSLAAAKKLQSTSSGGGGEVRSTGAGPSDARSETGEGPSGESDEGGFVAASTGGQISSRLLSMRSASALLELPQVIVVFATLPAHLWQSLW